MGTTSRGATVNLQEQMYESLYAEIRENSTIVANLFTVTITAAATIVSFGVQLEQPGLFLATFILLIPSLSVISSQMASTARIGAYISVKLENEDSGISWETDVWAFRKSGSERYGVSVASLYAVIGVACLGLAFYYLPYDDTAAVVVVAGVSVFSAVALGVVLVQALRALSTANRTRMQQAWMEVLDARDDG